MPAITITVEEFEELRAEAGGLCLFCGLFHFEIDPDYRRGVCEMCGEPRVYSADMLMDMGRVI